jgi:hypothetical protein
MGSFLAKLQCTQFVMQERREDDGSSDFAASGLTERNCTTRKLLFLIIGEVIALSGNEEERNRQSPLKIGKVKTVGSSPFCTGNITCFFGQPKLRFTDDLSYDN